MEKCWKKVLTVGGDSVNITFVAETTAADQKKVLKKVLDEIKDIW